MSRPTHRVLVVEDNASDSSLLALMLRQGGDFSVTQAALLSEALAQLEDTPFDVIISDLTLPDSQGFGTFAELQKHSTRTPIIVISGTDDEEFAVQAVREGAQDYLVKGRFEANALRRAIRYAIERERIEQALIESHSHYKRLLESVTDYTYVVRLRDGEVVQTVHHPNCVSITGYTADQYRDDPKLWLRMVPPEDQRAVLAQAERVKHGETPPPCEHRIFHKDGRVRWVRNTVIGFRDADGKVLGYDGLIRDITARKVAEEQLVKSEAFYHSLVETLPQHIIRKDLNERFTFANQRFCQLVGKPLADVVGKTDFDFFNPDLASKYQNDDRFVIRTGKTFETVEENQTPGGEKRYVNVIKTPIHDPKGRIIGIQGIFWDITEKRRAEEQLKRANEDLRRASETLKNAQQQLIQAAKMESIGTLAAGVAHEVKNPLATLTMGLNYLDKNISGKDANVEMVLKEMRDAITRADKITRGLLDFSAARQLDVRSEQLNSILEQTLVLLRHELNKQQIELVTQFAPDLPPVAIEKNQIQQVFVNVFMNAIQAMPGGGKLVVSTARKRLARLPHGEGSRSSDRLLLGDDVVVTEISDSGPGIPAEHLSQIFDPFFTTKPTGVGTGLGLPVSRKIVELHGGTMDVSNRPEGGVKVTIGLRPRRSHEKESAVGG